MIVACQYGHHEVVETLLQKGANVNSRMKVNIFELKNIISPKIVIHK